MLLALAIRIDTHTYKTNSVIYNLNNAVYDFIFKQEVKANPHNYDAWFDYLRLLESDGEVDQVRECYERAIANVPPSKVWTQSHVDIQVGLTCITFCSPAV